MTKIKIIHSLIIFILFISSALAGSVSDNDKLTKKKNKDQFTEFVTNKLNRLKANTKKVGNKLIDTMDVNRDGKIDSRIIYLSGSLFKEEADFNFDGKFDKTDWYYKTGDIIQSTTIDRNFDGKVDLKIIKTRKGAKKGHYITIHYKDHNFDGIFDSKKTTENSELQASWQASNGQEPSVNCAVDQYADVHLPAILKATDRKLVDELKQVIGRPNYLAYFNPTAKTYGFDIKVQSACKQEGSEADRRLFKNENIQESIKKGVICMGKFDNNQNLQASINFRKVLAGLTGHDVDDNGTKINRHNSPLKLICKLEDTSSFDWDTNLAGTERVQTLAVATTTNDSRILQSNPNITKVDDPPLIIFRPGLAAALDKSMTYYPTQRDDEKFAKLIFHEYLHTSLGTTHAANEDNLNPNISPDYSQQTTVDYAQACGDFCFSGTGQDSKLTELSEVICKGTFQYPSSGSNDSNVRGYAQTMTEIRNIKIRMKEQSSQILQ